MANQNSTTVKYRSTSTRKRHILTPDASRIFPILFYNNDVNMIDWLSEAFGFTVHAKYINIADVDHAELAFGSSMIIVGSSHPDE